MTIQDMTWEPSRKSWSKMFKGKCYRVSCAELKVPPSQHTSAAAAAKWWRAMRRSLSHSQSSVADLAKLLDQLPVAPHDLRLWALLCLNGGLTVAELGTLSWDHVDLDRGELNRTKARTGYVVPFKLWPETLEQLRSIPHRKGLVLLDPKTQTPMYRTTPTGTKQDKLICCWRRFSLDKSIRLGSLRRIAAGLLSRRVEFHDVVALYLGHAPRQTNAIHYSMLNSEHLRNALEYQRATLIGSDWKPSSKKCHERLR